MMKFVVRCRVDAYVDYRAEVVADDAEEASQLAKDCPYDYTWEKEGPVEFDARGYITLDDKGNEIDGTQAGYFG